MFASRCCIFIFIAGPSHFLLHNAVVLVLLMNKTNNAETSTVLSVDLFISTLQLFQIGWCVLFLLFTEMPLENLHFFRMTSIINAQRPSSRTRPFLPLLAHNQSFQDTLASTLQQRHLLFRPRALLGLAAVGGIKYISRYNKNM